MSMKHMVMPIQWDTLLMETLHAALLFSPH
jgi:hypothetical protein